MKVLVTGATGNVGSVLVPELIKRGADVRIFTRKQPNQDAWPKNIEIAIGDLLDAESVARAMEGIDKLFLLAAVSPRELMEAMIGFGMAKRAGVKHVTYLSAFKVDVMRDAPHMAAKFTVENAIRHSGIPFTILRPNGFMQAEAQAIKPVIMGMGFYPVPIGDDGISLVDTRDIAEAAAISLTEDGHEGQTYDLVGPTIVTGASNAALWSKLLGKPVQYTGHDMDRWEAMARGHMPSWLIYDLRAMYEGFHSEGFTATAVQIARLTKLLGHAPRGYEAFATQTASEWKG
ncbi:MAG: NAD(P)H-binding protein [Bradyrhizobium sp.]|nr:NAD(P)H-binding protein [Bradyrhizobium sp.]